MLICKQFVTCRSCVCACFSVCAGFCCPWALLGQNADRLPSGHYCTNGTCVVSGFIYLACCCIPCIGGPLWAAVHHCSIRKSLRKTYGLAPEPYPDCCVALLCPCCAVIQEHNELDKRGATQFNVPNADAVPIVYNGMQKHCTHACTCTCSIHINIHTCKHVNFNLYVCMHVQGGAFPKLKM